MKKMPSTLTNMILSLTLIASVAGLGLSVVSAVTAEPIALARQAKLEAAINMVLPDFYRLGEAEIREVDGGVLTFYRAYDENDELIGTAIATFSLKAFTGGRPFRLMAGFLPDGTIYNIDVLEHSETPGLGDKIEHRKSTWPRQFQGKHPATFDLRVKNDGGQIDAITAATITARAYSDAVQRAFDNLK